MRRSFSAANFTVQIFREGSKTSDRLHIPLAGHRHIVFTRSYIDASSSRVEQWKATVFRLFHLSQLLLNWFPHSILSRLKVGRVAARERLLGNLLNGIDSMIGSS